MAKNTKIQSGNSQQLKEVVMEFFNNNTTQAYNYKQVSAEIGVETASMRADVAELLEQLAEDGYVTEVSPGKYKMHKQALVSVGRFIRRSNGKNSVQIEDDENFPNPIFVAERHSLHALNGDKVRVHISAARAGMDPEAEVLDIIERKDQVFIGTLHVKKYYSYVVTDSKFLATDIFIPRNTEGEAHTGDKVVVKIVDWPSDANSPTGKIVDVLGAAGENEAEIHAILAEYGLPYHYPEDVEKFAETIESGITKAEIASRRDMRDVTTFTIDPHDAKDYDDALSVRQLENGHWEVGVHIADVTHYVKPNTILDQEAYDRATSIYLVDRTIPMLPERLCNGICSLRPEEEKLCYSCIFELDDDAKVIKSDICHTVICSNHRFAYEDAQKIIEEGLGEYATELLKLNELAQILRQRRFDEGAVNFDRCEVRFDIDDSGKPVSVYFKESKEANKLIEEFMLLANRTVAEFIGAASHPKAFVYRIHDNPDEEKLANMKKIAGTFGHKVKVEGKAREVNRSLNEMLKEIKGKGEENLISLLAMRSMSKAVYSTENIGHYGLAFDYYTHFTSPIRRYPDMMVHRLLDRYIAGKSSVNVAALEENCQHCSEQEQLAANAERASIKFKQVEYLGERLGEVYDGMISGVTEWGIYVELDENKCEGMVPIRDLDDDYYEFDEKEYCLVGMRTHRRYQLGDKVKIQIARADLIKKTLDFALVDERHPVNPKLKDGKVITYDFQLAQQQQKSSSGASRGGHSSRRRRHGADNNPAAGFESNPSNKRKRKNKGPKSDKNKGRRNFSGKKKEKQNKPNKKG